MKPTKKIWLTQWVPKIDCVQERERERERLKRQRQKQVGSKQERVVRNSKNKLSFDESEIESLSYSRVKDIELEK